MLLVSAIVWHHATRPFGHRAALIGGANDYSGNLLIFQPGFVLMTPIHPTRAPLRSRRRKLLSVVSSYTAPSLSYLTDTAEFHHNSSLICTRTC